MIQSKTMEETKPANAIKSGFPFIATGKLKTHQQRPKFAWMAIGLTIRQGILPFVSPIDARAFI
jgi:hypothetical protein